MASKNFLIAVAGGIGLACALTAGLAHLAGIGSNAGKSNSKQVAVNSGEHGPQSFPQLDADGTSHGSKGKNTATEGDEARSDKQIVAQPARPDEPMSPDEYEPSELSKMGDDLRHHPRDIAQLLEQLKNETDPEKIKMLAQLIAENAEAAGLEIPVKDLLEMAASDLPMKRQAALMLLSTIKDVTPEMMQTVSNMARADATNDVRLAAIHTMGRWIDRDGTLSEQLSMDIIGARDASTSPEVRGYAIQTVGLQKNGLPGNLVAPVAESLRIETVPENRSLAALALSHTQDTAQPQALQNLQSAYNAETDLDAKRHLLTMIMRTSGDKAAQILKNLPANDPLLRQDINDYVDIMGSGVTDVNQIYEMKNQRDGDRGTETDMDAACLQH